MKEISEGSDTQKQKMKQTLEYFTLWDHIQMLRYATQWGFIVLFLSNIIDTTNNSGFFLNLKKKKRQHHFFVWSYQQSKKETSLNLKSCQHLTDLTLKIGKLLPCSFLNLWLNANATPSNYQLKPWGFLVVADVWEAKCCAPFCLTILFYKNSKACMLFYDFRLT